MLSLGKKIGIFQQDAAPVVTPVAPVCADADTLCQFNEFLKEKGYDVPAAIEGRTGLQVPTHLPESVQNGLQYVNDKTGGVVTPARASIAAVAAGSVIGTLFTLWATRKLYNAIFKDCPTNVLKVIENDADAMAFFEQLTKDAKYDALIVALSQMNEAGVKHFFASLKNPVNDSTVAATILQMDADKQVGVVKSVMKKQSQKFNEAKQAKRLQQRAAAKAAEAKAVVVPGVQKDAAAPAVAAPSRSYLPTVGFGSYYIPYMSWKTPAATAAVETKVDATATDKPKM